MLLLTGSSRGIGLGIANYFLARGHIVCGCSRSESALDSPQYHHTRLDVSDEKAVRAWVSSVAKQFGRIDTAVCNAGIVKSALMMSVTPASILDQFVATHVRGVFLVCREVSKVMIRQKSGRIVTLSSPAVAWHLKGASAYTATKAAVEEMTRVLARELAPAGVTCNVVRPGLVMTDPARAMGDEWAEWLLDQQTIRRTVTIEEICNVIEFFASPASSAITGQTLNMCLVG
ncbi:MAG: SDR family oxidoreductase [Gemmatimonadota bacterium]|nr:SDR family oxidoreductase [Gemmatimonadota bacterium]